jgi:hypothetical protein
MTSPLKSELVKSGLVADIIKGVFNLYGSNTFEIWSNPDSEDAWNKLKIRATPNIRRLFIMLIKVEKKKYEYVTTTRDYYVSDNYKKEDVDKLKTELDTNVKSLKSFYEDKQTSFKMNKSAEEYVKNYIQRLYNNI